MLPFQNRWTCHLPAGPLPELLSPSNLCFQARGWTCAKTFGIGRPGPLAQVRWGKRPVETLVSGWGSSCALGHNPRRAADAVSCPNTLMKVSPGADVSPWRTLANGKNRVWSGRDRPPGPPHPFAPSTFLVLNLAPDRRQDWATKVAFPKTSTTLKSTPHLPPPQPVLVTLLAGPHRATLLQGWGTHPHYSPVQL